MKNIILVLLTIFSFYSCSSNSSKTTDESKSKMEVGVENVNGNIPDTTNAIDLNTHKKDSSARKDSVH